MSFFLTFSIYFGIAFAIALIVGYFYEKELVEAERVIVKYIKLKIKAHKAGMSVEEYVDNLKAQKRQRAAQQTSGIINFNDYVA